MRFESNGEFTSPGFDVSDVGFIQRADQVRTGSNTRRKVSVHYSGSYFWDGHGSTWNEFEARITIRPTPAFSAVAGLRV